MSLVSCGSGSFSDPCSTPGASGASFCVRSGSSGSSSGPSGAIGRSGTEPGSPAGGAPPGRSGGSGNPGSVMQGPAFPEGPAQRSRSRRDTLHLHVGVRESRDGGSGNGAPTLRASGGRRRGGASLRRHSPIRTPNRPSGASCEGARLGGAAPLPCGSRALDSGRDALRSRYATPPAGRQSRAPCRTWSGSQGSAGSARSRSVASPPRRQRAPTGPGSRGRWSP